jgi:RNA polymerase sigma factor (sigma-70 family)
VAYQSIPTQSRAEEQRDIRRAQRGDEAARQRVLRANLRYVEQISRCYTNWRCTAADLMSEGTLALMHALDKFDPEMGTRFVTYASYWIRTRVSDCALRSMQSVGTGATMRQLRLLRRARAKLQAETGAVTESQLAEAVGVGVERLRDLALCLDGWEVEYPSADSHTPRQLRTTRTPEELALASEVEEETWMRAHRALCALDPREQTVARRRLMQDEPDTLEAIGRDLGVCRERVRQIECRVRKKLTVALRPAGLRQNARSRKAA